MIDLILRKRMHLIALGEIETSDKGRGKFLRLTGVCWICLTFFYQTGMTSSQLTKQEEK
jgi:hypothetical protein